MRQYHYCGYTERGRAIELVSRNSAVAALSYRGLDIGTILSHSA